MANFNFYDFLTLFTNAAIFIFHKYHKKGLFLIGKIENAFLYRFHWLLNNEKLYSKRDKAFYIFLWIYKGRTPFLFLINW